VSTPSDNIPGISTPDSTPAPILGEVMAVEVEVEAERRHSTRDFEQVAAIVASMGDPATWTSGPPPLCTPHLWVRFVPPSAEGGASVVFCSASSTAALWIPGHGGYHLDEANSQALYAAAFPVSTSPDGALPPTDVSENLAHFSLSIELRTITEGHLRSLQMASGERLELDMLWPDGSPMTASHILTAEVAGVLAALLADGGLFAQAQHYHSPTTASSTAEPPPESTKGVPPEDEKIGWVAVTVTTDAWHRTWHVSTDASTLSWYINALKGVEEAAWSADLAELSAQVEP